MGRTVTILGASGLVGGHLLQILLKDEKTSLIRALVRKTLPVNDPKLEQYVIDFGNPKAYEPHVSGAEVVFCAVGTTNRKVQGDKELYKKVDFDIPVNAAKAAARYGVYSFVMVSAIGADPANNNNFYLKLKGVTEEAVCKEQIPQIQIMRPSLILGERQERRLLEKAAQAVIPVFNWALRGKAEKYKAIAAEDIARAMQASSFIPAKGIKIYTYREMMDLAV